MLEVTLLHTRDGGQAAMRTFQFENDELQAFLTECSTNETGCQITSLRALGVPLTVTADMPKQHAKARAAKAEADEARADAKARLNQPIQRAKAQPIDESQPVARTAGPGSVRSETPAKPTTERK